MQGSGVWRLADVHPRGSLKSFKRKKDHAVQPCHRDRKATSKQAALDASSNNDDNALEEDRIPFPPQAIGAAVALEDLYRPWEEAEVGS